MSRQRWGTFSVVDHLRPKAFISDVLLYDQLVIPVPSDKGERERWQKIGRNPDQLDGTLDLLGDIAIRVPWDQNKQDLFKNLYAAANGVNFDVRNLAKAKVDKTDPLYITRMILAQDSKNIAGDNIVWAMAAYPSFNDYKEDANKATKEKRKEQLAMVISQKFLVPDDPKKSDAELLDQAIKLSRRDDFRKKRALLHQYQEEIIEQEIPPDKAIMEMEEFLKQYNKIIKKAKLEMRWKYAFLVIEVGIGLAGAAAINPLVIGAATAGIAKFMMFDRKLKIDASECSKVAMLHDVQNIKWN